MGLHSPGALCKVSLTWAVTHVELTGGVRDSEKNGEKSLREPGFGTAFAELLDKWKEKGDGKAA